ncbi:hypothetical protein AX17_001493 [Amanita inopinata Kibby_2008]|nr:hypothetical protein AX17_001493 [Amanita inopinata Kibby_2008]
MPTAETHMSGNNTVEPVHNDTASSPICKTGCLGKRKHNARYDSLLDEMPRFKQARLVQSSPECYKIAFHAPIHNDIQKLSYGVQYTLAHLVTTSQINYADLSTEVLQELQGPNTRATNQTIMNLVKGNLASPSSLEQQFFTQEMAMNSPWAELNREEEAMAENKYAALGNYPNHPGWYGGKVVFRGKLEKHNGSYKVVLDQSALGSSCRFTRSFGSMSFLRLKVPSQIFYGNNDLPTFFSQYFVLWGHVFQACYAKDNNVFLLKINETMCSDGSLRSMPGQSLEDFVHWFNPFLENKKQPMSKWAARFSLGFSNSVPGPILSPQNILNEDDIVSEENSDMTDGCGFSNFTLLSYIHEHFELERIPTAIQFRLGGHKGMLILRTEYLQNGPPCSEFKVWLRPSQTKIKYPSTPELNPAHFTLDLLRTSSIRTPSQLSPEIIINLSENSFKPNSVNVIHQVLPDLMEKTLLEVVQALTEWDGPEAMFTLWSNVERAGNVNSIRRAREMVGLQRFKGIGNRDYEDEDEEDEDTRIDRDSEGEFDTTIGQRSLAWWPDQVSGCPSPLEETVLYLLDAGFVPQSCPILREKLKHAVTTKIKNKIEQMKITISCSATAFVIPDPFGVLEPNEIQLKSSHQNLKTPDGTNSDILLGDILLARNPCKVPTDVRKVKAVEHPKLHKYTNVIVCSIKGPRRFVDYLAGGDYDGDKAIAIWEPRLVEPFVNADDKFSVEPPELSGCFHSPKETVEEFSEHIKPMTREDRTRELQRYLLSTLNEMSLTGKYSVMHDNAVYSKGYSSPEAVMLAYKFCKVLDGTKSGLRIRDDVLREDQRQFRNTHGPEWKDPNGKKQKNDTSNLPFLSRPQRGQYIRGPFIMDVLVAAGRKLCDRLLNQMERVTFVPLSVDAMHDEDLKRPWKEALELVEQQMTVTTSFLENQGAQSLSRQPVSSSSSSGTKNNSLPTAIAKAKRRDLTRIQQHVRAVFKKHRERIRGTFTKLPITRRQDILRGLSKEFAEHPKVEEMEVTMDSAMIARLRASYAYIYDLEMHRNVGGWSRFPWNMAMRELCAMKANALGPSKVVTDGFYERFRLAKRP